MSHDIDEECAPRCIDTAQVICVMADITKGNTMARSNTRWYMNDFRDMPMPTLRDDAYYGAYMQEARKELEAHCYAFDTKDGREFEQGCEVSRYSNPSDYNPADFASHLDVWEWVFSRAIKARAARLYNIEHR